jgi:hypothetical protein
MLPGSYRELVFVSSDRTEAYQSYLPLVARMASLRTSRLYDGTCRTRLHTVTCQYMKNSVLAISSYLGVVVAVSDGRESIFFWCHCVCCLGSSVVCGNHSRDVRMQKRFGLRLDGSLLKL